MPSTSPSPALNERLTQGRGESPDRSLTRTARLLSALVLAPALAACRIDVVVPEGGSVTTTSGAYTCAAGSTCSIDVSDEFFNQTFIAEPAPGWVFRRWERGGKGFCGNRIGPCELSTLGFENSPELMDTLASDAVFSLRPLFEQVPRVLRKELQAEGEVSEDEDGMAVAGSLRMETGSGPSRLFTDANLQLGFSPSGKLRELSGVGILPHALTHGFLLDADVQADIGFLTGKEINADDDIPITLRDERRYFVFLVGGDVSYSFDRKVPADSGGGADTETEQVTLNTPAAGKVIMILDPNDDMIYRYGETPLKGGFGEAHSELALLPFVPKVAGDARVDRFDGNQYKTASVGVGIKAVDFFNISGEQVTFQSDLFDIDLSDPFNSDIRYQAGFNGAAEFALSVFGFSIEDQFQFDIAESSASFVVSKNRQAMTLVADLAQEELRFPAWMNLQPDSPVSLAFTANGKGKAAVQLAAEYVSTQPRAELDATVTITPEALTLRGRVGGPVELPVRISFRADGVYGDVMPPVDFTDHVDAGLDNGLDRVEAEVEQALFDLDRAIGDYEYELSLRGLRGALPGLADQGINALNQVPDIVYQTVYRQVSREIDNRNRCALGACLISRSTRNSKARSAGNQAEQQVRDALAPYLRALSELKRSAIEDTDEALIGSVEAALRNIHARRRFRDKVTVSVSVAGFKFTKSHSVDVSVLSSSQADAILTAADNIDRIPLAGERVVSARDVLERLPTREAIERARREARAGTADLPVLEAVSYSVVGGEYSAVASFSDGTLYGVDGNVLDWRDLRDSVAELLGRKLIRGLD